MMASMLDNSLQKWALDLTQRHKVFNPDQSLIPQNFSNLTRDDKLQPILGYLIRHVRPPEEQRQIKLNLKHAQLRKKLAGDECEISKSEEQFKLKAAIIDTRTAIATEVSEIQLQSHKKEECRQREVDFRRRKMLLKVVEEERLQEIERLKSWNSQLSLILNRLQEKKKKSLTVIDSSVQRSLRSNLLAIENLRHSVNSTEIPSQSRIHEAKVQLWEDIEETMDESGPRPLLLSLLGDVRESCKNLESLIQRVDLAKDASDLRLKCEKDGSFIDEMNPEGVIGSVRELLSQTSAVHVKLFIESHQAHEVASSLGRALASVIKNISIAAKRMYGEDLMPSVTNLVKENIAVVGERGALAMTQSLVVSLQKRAEVAARARDVLRSKYAKIVTFDKEVKLGVENIHSIALSINDGLHAVNAQIDQVKGNIGTVIESNAHPTPVSADVLWNEYAAFSELPLGYFLTINVDDYDMMLKLKMTTTPLVWYDKSQVENGMVALSILSSSNLCWDSLYDHVVDNLNHTNSLENQMEQLMSVRASVSSASKEKKILSRLKVKELIENAVQSDKRLEEEVRHLTEMHKKQMQDSTQFLKRVSQVILAWWEQPVKKVVIKKNVQDL